MADIKIVEVFDDSGVLGELEKIEKSLLGIGSAGEKTGEGIADGLKTGSEAAEKFTKSVNKTTAELADASAKTRSLTANMSVLKAKLGETINGFSVGGKTVAEWREQLKQSKDTAKDLAGSTEGMTRAQKVFNAVIKLSPLGILAALIGTVIVYFTRFQTGIDKVSQVTAAATAVFDKLIDRVSKVGAGVLSIVTGNFSQGISEISGAFTGLGTEIANAAEQAFNLEKSFQNLRDAQIASRVEVARQSAAVERLKEIGEDESLTYKERTRSLREAGGIETSLSETRVGLARKNFELVKAQNLILADNVERRERLADAEIELINAESEADKTRREIAKTLREIRQEQNEAAKAAYEEEKKRIEDLKKEYEKLIESVNAQNAALAIENENNPVERVNREWRKAIQEAELLRSQLYRLAPNADDRAFADQQISELFGRITSKYEDELSKAQTELENLRKEVRIDAFSPLPNPDVAGAEFEKRARQTVKIYGLLLKDEFAPGIEAILTEIAETFNLRGKQVIDVNEAKQLFDGLKSAFSDAYEGYKILNDIQLELSTKKIEQIDEQISVQETAIEKERKAQEDGLANNLSIEQRKLQELQAQRRKAAQDRLNLERKAATQQLIIDSAQQGSSLATMAANVIKAESNKGLLGVAFAISAIAFMFKIFAQAKANSQKLSDIPKLRKGKKLEGNTHEGGGNDIFVGGRHRYEAEAGEWLIGTKPSRLHDRFLSRLNNGEFDNYDLGKIFEARKESPYLSNRMVMAEKKPDNKKEFDMLIVNMKKGFKEVIDMNYKKQFSDGQKTVTRTGNVTVKK
jgi:hypothetical protein